MVWQIAANKRKAGFYIFGSCGVWAGIGAAIGAIFYPARVDPVTGILGTTHSQAIVAGVIIARVFALLAQLVALASGAPLVLSVSGARPADPQQYAQLHNIV